MGPSEGWAATDPRAAVIPFSSRTLRVEIYFHLVFCAFLSSLQLLLLRSFSHLFHPPMFAFFDNVQFTG